MIQEPPATPPSRREQGKDKRRVALLAAARSALLAGDFSMRRAAERAGVSETTPYNLFGSKSGMIEALYRTNIDASEARLPPSDALARFLAAIGLFADAMAAEPDFSRALFAARIGSRGGRFFPQGPDEGVAYWQRLLEATIASGQLRRDGSAALLGRHFIHLLSGSVREWIDGEISPAQWHAIVCHGFALLALPLAPPDTAAALQRRLADWASRATMPADGMERR